MPTPTYLILAALEMEARALRKALDGADCRIEVIGIRATRLTPDLCRSAPRIILAGIAGALDPTLHIGDVVLDYTTDQWPDLPLRPNHRRGSIHTSDHISATAAEKSDLFQKTASLAVDMESSIVRHHAAAAAVPLLILRAISDAAADDLPSEVLAWVDDVGNPRPPKVAAGLLRHPNLLPQVMRLGTRARLAAKNMADAVREIVKREQ